LKRVAVLQSNYLPWKGYFDIVHDVDLFIFYDDLQYTKNDWRKPQQAQDGKGRDLAHDTVGAHIHRRICDVELDDPSWQRKHWQAMSDWYATTPHFDRYGQILRRALSRSAVDASVRSEPVPDQGDRPRLSWA
jgi:hypothetical protein